MAMGNPFVENGREDSTGGGAAQAPQWGMERETLRDLKAVGKREFFRCKRRRCALRDGGANDAVALGGRGVVE